jgi:hypothetical protein
MEINMQIHRVETQSSIKTKGTEGAERDNTSVRNTINFLLPFKIFK